jgi:hypothetical protein
MLYHSIALCRGKKLVSDIDKMNVTPGKAAGHKRFDLYPHGLIDIFVLEMMCHIHSPV